MERVNEVILPNGKIICDNDYAHYKVEKLEWRVKSHDDCVYLVEPKIKFWNEMTLILYYWNDVPFELLKITKLGHVMSIFESKKLDTRIFDKPPFYNAKKRDHNKKKIRDFIISLLKENNLSSIKAEKLYARDLDEFYWLE